MPIANCQLPVSPMLQVYHNYKVLATNFLQNGTKSGCIKTVHLLYQKRTPS